MAAMAVLEAAKWPDRAADGRFHIATYKEFISWGWPDGLPETSFRATQNGRMLEAAAAYAPYVAIRAAQNTKGEGQASGRNGRFYQPEADKWPDLWLRAADSRFHIVP